VISSCSISGGPAIAQTFLACVEQRDAIDADAAAFAESQLGGAGP
jgi:hypothetical protein